MKRVLIFASAILFVGFSAVLAQSKNFQDKGKDSQAAESAPAPIPADAVNKVNPVKPTPEGLAAATTASKRPPVRYWRR